MSKTVNETRSELIEEFRKLSKSRQSTLRREARKYIEENPHCADNSSFWRGTVGHLSARQVSGIQS